MPITNNNCPALLLGLPARYPSGTFRPRVQRACAGSESGRVHPVLAMLLVLIAGLLAMFVQGSLMWIMFYGWRSYLHALGWR
jgi:hypothetical protein